MPRTILPTLALVFALTACGGDDVEEEVIPPAQFQPGNSDGGSILMHGDSQSHPGTEIKITQILAIEDGKVLQHIGEKEITGNIQIIQTEEQTIRFRENDIREIEIGDGGAELRIQMGELDAIDEAHPDPLAGKTVIATPGVDGDWIYTIKGEPGESPPVGFTAADIRADALYPETYLSFGDTWNPKPEAIAALLGPGFQFREGKITMRLITIENLDGQRCAVIGVDIEADGLFKSSGSRQDVSLRLKGKIYRSLHLFQDLKSDLSGNIELISKLGNAEVNIHGTSWKN